MIIKVDTSIHEPDFPIDTLLIAGTDHYHQAFDMIELQEWLRRHTPDIHRYGSVCTGVFFLGASGLLTGKRVTTHWQRVEELANLWPDVDVHPDSIYIQDGKLATSAGVTAGI